MNGVITILIDQYMSLEGNEFMSAVLSKKIMVINLFANLAIFMHHANLASLFLDKATTIDCAIMDFFSSIAMPAMTYFFFISGYLFYRNFKVQHVCKKWEKRVFSLLIPYVIWNTVAAIENLFNPDAVEKINNSFWGLLSDIFLFFPSRINSGGACANGPLWYIFRIMIFALLAPVFYYVLRKKLGIIVIMATCFLNYYYKVSYYHFCFFLPVYLIGAYIGIHYSFPFEEYIQKRDNSKKNMYVVISFLFFFFVLCITKGDQYYFGLTLRYTSIIPEVIILKYINIPQWDFDMRAFSMFLYCSHILFIKAFRVILLKYINSILTVYILTVVFSLFVIVVLYSILKKYMPKFLSICVGGR